MPPKATRVERMRLDLVAWAGHDLRTPLTSVTVIVEALADGLVTDPHTVERYLQTAKRDLRVLGLLIDDLSLLAQIDAGGLHLTQKRRFPGPPALRGGGLVLTAGPAEERALDEGDGSRDWSRLPLTRSRCAER